VKRILVISAFIVVAIFGLVTVATPWLLSSDIVKERIADRIEMLTGLETTLRGDPILSILPFLGIKLKDVVIATPAGLEAEFGDDPLVSMESLKGNLKLFSAITGKPELANFRLIRPKFNLKVSRTGKVNWHSNTGALSKLLSAAIKNKANNDLPTSSIKLGSFEITNGTINYQNDRLGQTAELTSVNIELSWPGTAEKATITGSMVWEGEIVKIDASADSPINLLAGGASDIMIDVISSPLNARFEGLADTNLRSQFSGTAEISSPSVRQFLAWTGYDLAPGSTPGELQLSSKLTANPNNMKFQDATISMDGNTGTGFMELTVSEANRIGLSGTLAFESLNFDPYFQALIKDNSDTGKPEIAKIGLIDEFDIDLRFSAETATLGTLELSSMAATAQIRDGGLILDVGEATLFGGMVQAQLQAAKEDDVPVGDLKLNLIDIELKQLSEFISPGGIIVIGKGTASLSLKSRGKNTSELIQRLNGNTTITASSGRIDGLDIAEIAIDGKKEIILDATKVLAKTTEYSKLKIAMQIANGIALLEDSQLEGKNLLAKIGGKVDLWRGSLAMNGRVLLSKSGAPAKQDNSDLTHNIPFFVGGTFSAPLIASDLFAEDSGLGR
jgi:AsmA protein